MSKAALHKVSDLLKWSLTIFVLVLIPSYWLHYGAENFLWFSDIALFLTVIALWTRSRLLNSMMLIGVFPFGDRRKTSFFNGPCGGNRWEVGRIEKGVGANKKQEGQALEP